MEIHCAEIKTRVTVFANDFASWMILCCNRYRVQLSFPTTQVRCDLTMTFAMTFALTMNVWQSHRSAALSSRSLQEQNSGIFFAA